MSASVDAMDADAMDGVMTFVVSAALISVIPAREGIPLSLNRENRRKAGFPRSRE